MSTSPSWTYSPSANSPTTLVNNMVTNWSNLNVSTNSNMTVSFILNILNVNSNWRSIFHITNSGNNCCSNSPGDRVPAVWITAGALTLLISSSTTNNGNDYFYSPSIPLNINTAVDIVWSSQNVKVYFNGLLVSQYNHSASLISATSGAQVYIADPWYSLGGFTVKSLSFYNGQHISTASQNTFYGNGNSKIACSKDKICVNNENNQTHYFCYGSTTGCLWNSNDCNTDSDCQAKYTSSSTRYTDAGSTCQTVTSNPAHWGNYTCQYPLYNAATTTWVFPPSLNTAMTLYPVNVGPLSSLGITSNSSMTLSFVINVQSINSNFRNIFHASNSGNDCCSNNPGDRVPAVWVTAGSLTLHISSSTTSNGNDYFYSSTLTLNQTTQVDIVWSGQNVYVYFNGTKVSQFTHSSPLISIAPISSTYICDPFYSTGGFTIKNLSLSNGTNITNSASSISGLKSGLLYSCYFNNYNFNNYNSPTNFSIFNTTANTSGTITDIQNSNDSNALSATYGITYNQYFAIKYSGYFVPDVTGTWKFLIGDINTNLPNDDVSYLWIGNNANSPTSSNALGMCYYYSSFSSCYLSISLTANQAYPLLMYLGQSWGGFVISLGIIPPNGSLTYDGSKYFYNGTAPVLSTSNFSKEYFSNMKEEENSNKVFLLEEEKYTKSFSNKNKFIATIIIIIIIIIILLFIKYK